MRALPAKSAIERTLLVSNYPFGHFHGFRQLVFMLDATAHISRFRHRETHVHYQHSIRSHRLWIADSLSLSMIDCRLRPTLPRRPVVKVGYPPQNVFSPISSGGLTSNPCTNTSGLSCPGLPQISTAGTCRSLAVPVLSGLHSSQDFNSRFKSRVAF